MNTYEIFLKNDKRMFYAQVGWLIVILNLGALLYTSYYLGKTQQTKWIIIVLISYLLFTAVYRFVRKRYFLGEAKHLPSFIILIFGWGYLGFPLLSLINAFFLPLSIITGRVPIVYINSKEILFPSLIKRKIQWNELNNLILKDGILTIDFKNNKLIQQYVEDGSAPTDEKEFNEFCQLQLYK